MTVINSASNKLLQKYLYKKMSCKDCDQKYIGCDQKYIGQTRTAAIKTRG